VDIAKSPLEYLMDKETCKIIDMALCSLDPRKQKILRDYYGFDDTRKNCREIGEELKLSAGRIQQLFNKALKQFRHPAARKVLADCLCEEVQRIVDEGICQRAIMCRNGNAPYWRTLTSIGIGRILILTCALSCRAKCKRKRMMAYFSTKQETDY